MFVRLVFLLGLEFSYDFIIIRQVEHKQTVKTFISKSTTALYLTSEYGAAFFFTILSATHNKFFINMKHCLKMKTKIYIDKYAMGNFLTSVSMYPSNPAKLVFEWDQMGQK